MSDIQTTVYSTLSLIEKEEIEHKVFMELGLYINVGDVIVSNNYYRTVTDLKIEEGKVFYQTGSSGWNEVSEYNKYGHTGIYNGSAQMMMDEARDILSGKTVIDEVVLDEPQEAGLIQVNKNDYTKKKAELVIKQNAITAKLNAVAILAESKRSEMRLWAESVGSELKRVEKIIWTLELYMGIDEDVVMIRDGVKAPDDYPIHLMQEMLYMDEEVGDPTNGGLDIRSIKVFDEWTTQHNEYFDTPNISLLIPHEKGIRIMRVRRDRKDYGDPYSNVIMNGENFKTYILIRNGEQIYKIHANISFGSKLIPNKDEIMNVLEKPSIWDKGKEKDKALDLIDVYRRNLLVIQGLIDRTEVFGKLAGKVNLIDSSALHKEQVILHYESDYSQFISDGRPSIQEIIDKGRESVKVGTKVLIYRTETSSSDKSSRFPNLAYNARIIPSFPAHGIYNISEICNSGYFGSYRFKYLPQDEYWNGQDYVERKKKVTFAVYSDEFINADAITHRDLNDIERMLHDRRERKNYDRYMYALRLLYDLKKGEFATELLFVKNVIQRELPGVDDLQIMDAIDWWKQKVKVTRSLGDDDAKALRMIVKHLKNK